MGGTVGCKPQAANARERRVLWLRAGKSDAAERKRPEVARQIENLASGDLGHPGGPPPP